MAPPQGMQGRFSGRLETKEDEKRLADECRLLGPYLCDPEGEQCLQTLAKIVRGIASGEVRAHVESRERELQVGGAHAGVAEGLAGPWASQPGNCGVCFLEPGQGH